MPIFSALFCSRVCQSQKCCLYITLHRFNTLIITVPSFEYEPLDLDLNPFNETSRAAFSCGVSGIKPIATIEWYFEMMSFGSGMGVAPGLMNGLITPDVGVAISSDLSRASVLVLEDARDGDEGLYRCHVTFTDGLTLSSRNASLRYNCKSIIYIAIFV